MRIDSYLHEKGFADSRTDAKGFVLSGGVTVNGRVIKKPSHDVSDGDEIIVDKSGKKYVSRGGLKLEGALDSFKISVEGRDCIDIGASSGGFTDCLLKHGAARVIAVDSGSGQLVDLLRRDERVAVYERYNARYMKPEDFEFAPSLAVMDVSFISATFIFEALSGVLSSGGEFVCLIKPQFEVGRELIGKGGIVKSENARLLAIERVISAASRFGFEYISHIKSPIDGGDGNVEYLAYFVNRK